MAFPIPRSLKKYYEERAVFKAVNELVGVLDGSKAPELIRKEAKDYNQALLMAAQVRADFVDLLFRVWDETFGKIEISVEESFCSQTYTISHIWKDRELGVSYYYGTKDDDYRSNILGVMTSTDGDLHEISLYVRRFDRTGDVADSPDRVPSGLEDWKITPPDNDDWWFENESVDMVRFLEDPGPTLEQFRRQAIKMGEFLASSPA